MDVLISCGKRGYTRLFQTEWNLCIKGKSLLSKSIFLIRELHVHTMAVTTTTRRRPGVQSSWLFPCHLRVSREGSFLSSSSELFSSCSDASSWGYGIKDSQTYSMCAFRVKVTLMIIIMWNLFEGDHDEYRRTRWCISRPETEAMRLTCETHTHYSTSEDTDVKYCLSCRLTSCVCSFLLRFLRKCKIFLLSCLESLETFLT